MVVLNGSRIIVLLIEKEGLKEGKLFVQWMCYVGKECKSVEDVRKQHSFFLVASLLELHFHDSD